jgi:anti-sigma B factor antagonist
MSGRSPVPGALAIACSVENGDASLSLEGELDLATATALEDRLNELEDHGSKHLTVDLGGLDFIDSTGLRVLIQASARAEQRGHELVLLPAQETVQQIFEVTGALRALHFAAFLV